MPFKKVRKFLHDLVHPPVNRPLSPMERSMQLPQGRPASIPVAWPQMSVIKMNSTFLEIVDTAFLRKGFVSFGMVALIYISINFPITVIPDMIKGLREGGETAMFVSGAFTILVSSLLIVFFVALLRFESFNYTHYPMIFNRKTRMVHVFLVARKGEYISVPWDDVFFYGEKIEKGTDFYIRGHKLAEDRETVLETFVLPFHSEFNSPYRFLLWEFVRQYMEGDEGKLAELADMVDEVAGVDGRREMPWEGFRQAWAGFAGSSLLLAILFSPLIFMATVGRIIAMWTSKFPRWPAEIAATCQFPPDDPNRRDAKRLAPRGKAKPPDVSAYVGR